MRISDWSSDVCSSDLAVRAVVSCNDSPLDHSLPLRRAAPPVCHPADNLLGFSGAGHRSRQGRGRKAMSTRPRADNSPGQWGPDERLHALRLCPLFRYWPETRLVEVAAIARARSYARRSEEHTSELQSLMRISYAVFCLKKKKKQ